MLMLSSQDWYSGPFKDVITEHLKPQDEEKCQNAHKCASGQMQTASNVYVWTQEQLLLFTGMILHYCVTECNKS